MIDMHSQSDVDQFRNLGKVLNVMLLTCKIGSLWLLALIKDYYLHIWNFQCIEYFIRKNWSFCYALKTST